MDNLTIILCMCIGNAVAWLLALYTERGAYLLIWNTVFGMLGAAAAAVLIAWTAPVLGVVGLLTVGPPFALLAIAAGHRIRRLVWRALSPERSRSGA